MPGLLHEFFILDIDDFFRRFLELNVYGTKNYFLIDDD